MSKLNRWLLVLLAAQLLVATTIYLVKADGEDNLKAVPLLNFEKSDLTKIVITNGEKQLKSAAQTDSAINSQPKKTGGSSVILSKQENNWILPQLNLLPVNQVKLDLTIGKLMGLKSNWPVATTEESHSRFAVAADDFQKRIQLFRGDQMVGELYLGTSPGFKRVHLRESGRDEVYNLELNQFDFSDDTVDWLDKTLLQVEAPTKLSFKDFSLEKSDEEWQLLPQNQLPEGKQLDTAKVESLVSKLNSFSVTDVVSDIKELDSAESYSITVEADKAYQLIFYKKDSNYWVKRDDLDWLFKLPSSDFKTFPEASIDKLLSEAQSSANQTAESSESQKAENQQEKVDE